MTAKSKGRFALSCLILIGLGTPALLHARSRFEATSNDELLRRSQAALASPDHGSGGLRAKAQALADLAELRSPPPNAEALAVDALRGPGGDGLAPYAGRLLLRLDADTWHAIAKLTFTGEITEARGEAALKAFVDANEARVTWEKRTGPAPAPSPARARAKAFATLLQLRALRHEEFAQALADTDPALRSAAPLAAGFLDLTKEDWQAIAALLRDPDPQVRQGAMQALMEDSAPNPAQFDSAVFALRYDTAVCDAVVTWFAHAELSQAQIDDLARDLHTCPEADQRRALNLLNTLVVTNPQKLLPGIAALASDPSIVPTAAQGALSLLQATADRLGRDARDARDANDKPAREQQLLANLTPLLRSPSITAPAHAILLGAVAKLQIDTNDLSDLFIRDYALANGSTLATAQQCLEHASTVNPAGFARAIWQAQHNPDARIAQAARNYTAEKQLAGVWMLALKEGTSAERHAALDSFEEHGIGPADWPALADSMQSPEPALRGKALRTLLHAAALQPRIDAPGRALVRDVLLAALQDPDPNVRRAALAQAGSDYVYGRPEARDAVIAHLNDPNADMQATAWNALATGLPGGVFGDLRQACPTFDATLKAAIWEGKPGIRTSAIRIWEIEHRGSPLPWPPQQILLLVTLLGFCAGFLGLLQGANWRERGVEFENLTPTDAEEEAEYATRAMGSLILSATLVVALVMLWAVAARAVALRYGLLCGLSLLTYTLAGTVVGRWGKLVRTGRLLDRLVALALVSLVTLPSLLLCAGIIATAFRSQDGLPVLLVLSQVAAMTAVFGIGAPTLRRIIQTFRTPAAPPIPQRPGTADRSIWGSDKPHHPPPCTLS